MPGVKPKSEKQWMAESDANTLVEAEMIKTDRARHTQALRAAKRLAQEAEKKTKSLKKVANKSGKK